MNLELTWTGRHLDLLLSCLNTVRGQQGRAGWRLELRRTLQLREDPHDIQQFVVKYPQ
jgi:hypothetical protein